MKAPENVQVIKTPRKEVEKYRLRYEPRSLNSVLSAAARRSMQSEVPVFIFPVATGYKTSLKRPSLPFGHPMFRVVYKGEETTIERY